MTVRAAAARHRGPTDATGNHDPCRRWTATTTPARTIPARIVRIQLNTPTGVDFGIKAAGTVDATLCGAGPGCDPAGIDTSSASSAISAGESPLAMAGDFVQASSSFQSAVRSRSKPG